MRNYRNLVILAVVSAALVVPVCTTLAKAPKAVVDAGSLIPAVDVFRGTKYVNVYSQAAAVDGAEGSFTVDQPASAKWVTFFIGVNNLIPNSTYRVYFDWNGINESAPIGDCSTAGPCTLMGTLTTDASGIGSYYYEGLSLPVGVYSLSVYINQIGVKINHTVLISDNLDFTINP